MTVEELSKLKVNELEQLYALKDKIEMPQSGSYKGRVLGHIPTTEKKNPHIIFADLILFELLPFGVNFYGDKGDWFFIDRHLSTAQFTASHQTSKWCEIEVIAFDYKKARLPYIIRNILYDEIKPLSETLLLGMGGVTEKGTTLKYFYFSLEKTKKILFF